jgi:hypothetical protein
MMLANLPLVRQETVEAQKAQLHWREEKELSCCLNDLAERNPLLAERVLKAVEACLDPEAAPDLLCISEETVKLVQASVIQSMLLLLDLVDREVFATKQESLMAR